MPFTIIFYVTGYTIPKNTIIYPCLRQIMKDPGYWKDPEKFYPERFISVDEEGNQKMAKNAERVVSFGIGN